MLEQQQQQEALAAAWEPLNTSCLDLSELAFLNITTQIYPVV